MTLSIDYFLVYFGQSTTIIDEVRSMNKRREACKIQYFSYVYDLFLIMVKCKLYSYYTRVTLMDMVILANRIRTEHLLNDFDEK